MALFKKDKPKTAKEIEKEMEEIKISLEKARLEEQKEADKKKLKEQIEENEEVQEYESDEAKEDIEFIDFVLNYAEKSGYEETIHLLEHVKLELMIDMIATRLNPQPSENEELEESA